MPIKLFFKTNQATFIHLALGIHLCVLIYKEINMLCINTEHGQYMSTIYKWPTCKYVLRWNTVKL